ncbi:MAG TPA: ABC transporter permease [Syntrophomonadaceae bacterium]|nr:ABC transporter permease [Syntrophomonadaceae bacterium]HOQ08595.1 ABC transporter permease [Syntrophomonadaceae bacterium]HPU49436.1 ABC transporter permease [Syntrophomonadaceae bacterium]
MNKRDILHMSLVNMLRRKTRSVLTIIGVVIGTSAIVVMMSLGLAIDKTYQEQLGQMGSLSIIDVYPFAPYIEGSVSYNPGEVRLDDQAIEQFKSIPGVEAVMPQKTAYMRVAAGRMVADMTVVGIKPELLEAFDFEVESGRLLQAGDKNAVIFGKYVSNFFFNPRLSSQRWGPNSSGQSQVDLLSNNLLITSDLSYGERRRSSDTGDDSKPPQPHEIKGVGIIKESGSEKDYQAYMNITALEEILKADERFQRSQSSGRWSRGSSFQQSGYEQVKVKVADIELVEEVQKQIRNLGFESHSLLDMLNSIKEYSRTVQAILGGIGAVSLLVAAIGITNTMVMSIYERTREIGVMKVLGADLKDIGQMFLLEAGLIGFWGGGLGVAFSYLISFLLNRLSAGLMGGMLGGTPGQISIITPLLAVSALVFATMIGLLAGYLPARRAMHLSALDALRSEA